MAEILLEVKDTSLALISPKSLVGTQVNYNTCKFNFGVEWCDYVKTAVFYTDKAETYSMVLGADDTCIVPWEAMTAPGILYIGAFGVKDNVEIPTNFIMLRILEGSAGGNAPPPPTLDVYAQIIEQLRQTRDYTLEQANIATAAADDASRSEAAAELAKDGTLQLKIDTQKIKDDAIAEIATDKGDALQAISAAETDSLAAIGLKEVDALNSVATAKTSALQAITTDKTAALQAISTDKNTALTAINTTKNTAVQTVNTAGTQNKQTLDNTLADAMAEIAVQTSKFNNIVTVSTTQPAFGIWLKEV